MSGRSRLFGLFRQTRVVTLVGTASDAVRRVEARAEVSRSEIMDRRWNEYFEALDALRAWRRTGERAPGVRSAFGVVRWLGGQFWAVLRPWLYLVGLLAITLTLLLVFVAMVGLSLYYAFPLGRWFGAASTRLASSLPLPWLIALLSGLLVSYLAIAMLTFRNVSTPAKAEQFVLPFVLMAAYVLFGIIVAARAAWLHPAQIDRSQQVALAVFMTFASLILGGLAYYAKRSNKFVYGCSEVLVAIVSTWFVMSRIAGNIRASGFQEWVAAAASVYLFSRGLGNVAEGFEERPRQQPPKDDDAGAVARGA